MRRIFLQMVVAMCGATTALPIDAELTEPIVETPCFTQKFGILEAWMDNCTSSFREMEMFAQYACKHNVTLYEVCTMDQR